MPRKSDSSSTNTANTEPSPDIGAKPVNSTPAPPPTPEQDSEILQPAPPETEEPDAHGAKIEEIAPPQEAKIEEIVPAEAQEPELEESAADVPADIETLGEPPAVESPTQAKQIIEALLFASGEPVSARRIAHTLGMEVAQVRHLMEQMIEDSQRQERGILLSEGADGYQLSTRPEMADWILRLFHHKRRSPLSAAALETLAIIAYKQPIIRAEVDAIRGVESSGVIRTLLDLNLVEVKGRKEVIGRPQLYGTTDAFLRAFGLRRLDDLPSIQELRERFHLSAGRQE